MSDAVQLQKWTPELAGVFTLGDLRVLFGDVTTAGVYKKVERLVQRGELVKVMRGLYALPTASLLDISHRIEPSAYISTGTALSRALKIGSIPARRVQAVKVGVPRVYSCSLGTIEHLSIAPHLFFGFTEKNGIRMATPEKAWLDTCYYAYKGRRFSFDLDTDVNRKGLNQKRITRYLAAYDARFRQAYQRLWRAT
ncbi:MAG: hypothetical protein GX803_06945 [Lentisphaerae bacterium]|jgi:hypothetical protein|nr:hypothetical protein [Lentisphaerota bacterium]